MKYVKALQDFSRADRNIQTGDFLHLNDTEAAQLLSAGLVVEQPTVPMSGPPPSMSLAGPAESDPAK